MIKHRRTHDLTLK